MINPETFAKVVGRQITLHRLKKRLSREKLAEKLDTHENSVASYEHGKIAIKALMLCRICDVLDLDVGELFRQIPRKRK